MNDGGAVVDDEAVLEGLNVPEVVPVGEPAGEADEEGVLVATADTLDRLDTDDELLTEPEEVGLTLEVPLPEEVRVLLAVVVPETELGPLGVLEPLSLGEVLGDGELDAELAEE